MEEKILQKKKELQFTIFITIFITIFLTTLQFNLPELKSSKKSFILAKQSLVFVFNPKKEKELYLMKFKFNY